MHYAKNEAFDSVKVGLVGQRKLCSSKDLNGFRSEGSDYLLCPIERNLLSVSPVLNATHLLQRLRLENGRRPPNNMRMKKGGLGSYTKACLPRKSFS